MGVFGAALAAQGPCGGGLAMELGGSGRLAAQSNHL